MELTFLALLLTASLVSGEAPNAPPAVDPAWMAFRRGDYELALSQYQASCTDMKYAESRTVLEFTDVLLELGRFEEAQKACASFLKEKPGEAQVHTRLGEIAHATGDYKTAEEAFGLALKASPLSPQARFGLAMVFRSTGREKEAKTLLQALADEYLEQRPADPDSLLSYGFAFEQANRPHQALDLFDKAAKISEDPTEARLASGFLFLSKGQINDAAAEFRPVLAKNPKNPFAHLGMAGCHFQDGDFPKVTGECEAALKANPELPQALAMLADLEIHDEDYSEATRLLQQALKVNPNDVQVRTRLATVHYLKKDTEAYERERKAVIDVQPTYADFYRMIGSAAERLSRLDMAQQFFEKARQTDPESWQALESLGFFYCRIGKEKEAYEILEKSFESNRFNRRVFNLLQTLDYMDDFVTEEDENFKLRVHRQKDGFLIGYAKQYLHEARKRLAEQYKLPLEAQVIVEMFPRHDFFAARVHGLPGIDLNGVCFGNVIAMDSPRVAPGHFNWVEVLDHEFSHTMTLAATNHQIPRWLTEGLAVYDEQAERSYPQDQMLVTAWKKGELIPIERLNRAFTRPKSRFQVLLGYVQSELAAEYIIKAHGMPRILGMFEGFRRGDDLEKALQEHLGQSLKEFSDAVLGYTASVAASIPLAAQYGPEDLEVLRKAAAANPKDAAAKAEHALGLLQTEKAAQAAEEAASAIKLEPSCAPAERVLGEVKVSQGAFEDAIKHLTRSAELNPRQMDVHLRLASIAREQNRLTEAVEHLRKAAECYSRSPAVYQLMEEVADRLTDTKLRLDALEGMLKCRPSAAYAAEKLVKVYAAVERHEDVERVARIFFQYNPYLTGPHEVLARSYQARKKLDAAAQECLVCVQIDPRKIENHLTLAKVLLANDQRPEAKRVLTEASKADPKNEEVKRLLDELGP